MKIITGCMRSGTSFTCNLIHHLGGDFGQESQILPGDIWNPKGHFENRDMNLLNHELLFGHWTSPTLWVDHMWPKNPWIRLRKLAGLGLAPIATQQRLIDKRSKAHASQIAEYSTQRSGKYVKDPRFSYLLPVWEEYGNIDKVLYCLRDPREVSKSLSRQTGLPVFLSRLAWYDATEFFWKSDINPKVQLVDFNNFLDKSKAMKEMEIIFHFMDIPYCEKKAAYALDSVLEAKLINSAANNQNLPEKYQARYDALKRRHKQLISTM